MKFSSTSATLLASASIAFAAPHGPPGGPLPPHVPAVPVGPAHRSPPPPPPPHGNGPKSPGKPRGPPSPKRCENPIVRKEWRALGDVERQEYIDAVLCLQSKEPITKEQFADNDKFNPLNRYDDFQAVHSSQADKIHFVGHFAQWHRYFTAEYERTLRDVCGYKGAQPYWNWSLDANPDDVMSMAAYDSEIFSPTKGFGGNGKWVEVDPSEDIFGLAQFGRSGGGCVQDGPFTRPNFHVNIGEKNGSGQCLRRDFLPGIFNFFADPKTLEKTINEPDFAAFASTLEGRPSFAVSNVHGSGHFGVGGVLGQAGDAANSPGDPLFYLHHSMVDYVYWQWQQKDLENRLHEVGGSTTPLDFSYSSGVNVTLDFEVNLGAIAPSVKVSELLDTEGEILCYTYE